MKKKYIFILIISISFVNCVKLSDNDINKMILTYQDINKLNEYYENAKNIPHNEHWDKYLATYVDIEINEIHWNKIIYLINKSKYSLTNLDFIKKRYRISQPIYKLKIIYKNGNEIKIDIWEWILNINKIWYETTDESGELIIIIEEIIINNYENELI
jgi:hypothetical protein